MSTLLKRAQNTIQGKNNKNSNITNGERKWIHPPEALQKGHIAYLVKFLGNTVVDQPKGEYIFMYDCFAKNITTLMKISALTF